MSGETLLSTIAYENRTLPAVMQRAAELFGDHPFITAPGGAMTFRETLAAVARVAGGLQSVGNGPPQNVALFASNRIELPIAWWATNWLGAVTVLVHSAYRDSFLSRAIDFCDAKVLIVDAELIHEVAVVAGALSKLETVIVIGDEPFEKWNGPQFIGWAELDTASPAAPADVQPLDPATIMYTSGTTGPSKAVIKSHHYEFVYGTFTVAAAQLTEFKPHLVLPTGYARNHCQ